MNAQATAISPSTVTPFREAAAEQVRIKLRPSLMLVTMSVFFFVTLELDVALYIDSFYRYLTLSEIATCAGMAVLILLGFAIVCWLCVLLIAGVANLVPAMKARSASLGWYLGFTIAFSYFIFAFLGGVKMLILPHWHPAPRILVLVVCLFSVLCIVGLCKVGARRLQDFSRTRFVPVFWVHMALGVLAVISLWSSGAYLFHDYVRPGATVASSQSPDIYLITIDALRAEDMSVYGYSRPTTPQLERFAQRSFTFDYFFANSNITAPTTTSIETGKLPWSHRVFQLGAFLRGADQRENLPELLHRRGYYTAMISSNLAATPFRHRTLASYDSVQYVAPLGLTGIWLRYTNFVGVDSQWVLYAGMLARVGRIRNYLEAIIWPNRYPSPPEAAISRARALLERPDIRQPHFLWLHIMAPHDPYLPPPPYRKRFLSTTEATRYDEFLRLQNSSAPRGLSATSLRARYDEMVLYADDTVGNFLTWLEQTGRLDHSVVIVSADHGESFEHNWFLHGGPLLYNGLIRIPLLIHLPEQQHGARISQPAEQADLLPTLMDLVGGEVPSWTEGISLRPALEGKPLPDRLIFSMNLEPGRVFDPISKGTVAIVNDQFKYITRLGPESEPGTLYRYRTDPSEEHDLAQSAPETAKQMNDALLSKLGEINERWVARK